MHMCVCVHVGVCVCCMYAFVCVCVCIDMRVVCVCMHVMYVCMCYVYMYACVRMCVRGETIRANAVLHIVFECIAIYRHIAIFDWIMDFGKKTFHMGIWIK